MKGFFSAFKDFDTKLERICRDTGNTKKLDALLKKKHPDLNTIFFDGFSPLQTACMYQKSDVVRHLLNDDSIDISARDNHPDVGSTILHIAAWRGSSDVIRLILTRAKQNKAFDINCSTYSGFTALHYACAAGHIDAVLVLGQAGASPHIKTKDGSTPLHLAVRRGHLDIVQYLIDSLHADMDTVDIRRSSILHHACWEGHRDIIAYLFERGVDFELQDSRHRVCIEVCQSKEIQQFASALFIAARDQRATQGPGVPLSLELPTSPIMNTSPPVMDLSPAAFRSISQSFSPIGDGLLPDISLLTPKKPKTPVSAPIPASASPIPPSFASPSAAISPEAAKRLDESQAALAMANQLLEAFNQAEEHTTTEIPIDSQQPAISPSISSGILETIKEDEVTSDVEEDERSRDTSVKVDDTCEDAVMARPEEVLQPGAKVDEIREESSLVAEEHENVQSPADAVSEDSGLASAALESQQPVNAVESVKVSEEKIYHHDDIGQAGALPSVKELIEVSSEELPLADVMCTVSKVDSELVRVAPVDNPLEIEKTEEQLSSHTEEKLSQPSYDAKAADGVSENISAIPIDVQNTLWKICKESGDVSALKELVARYPGMLSSNIRDWDQWTPLIRACYSGHAGVVEYLLANGGDVQSRDGYGFTALHRAAWGGHMPIVQILVNEAHTDINATNGEGYSVLHKAAANGHDDICRYLISQGASVNARTSEGLTPLHMVCKRNHVDVVRALLDNGADASMLTQHGETCEQLTKSKEIKEILRKQIRNISVENSVDDSDTAQPIPSPRRSVQAGMHTTAHVSASSGDEPELVELAQHVCFSPSSGLNSDALENLHSSSSTDDVEIDGDELLSDNMRIFERPQQHERVARDNDYICKDSGETTEILQHASEDDLSSPQHHEMNGSSVPEDMDHESIEIVPTSTASELVHVNAVDEVESHAVEDKLAQELEEPEVLFSDSSPTSDYGSRQKQSLVLSSDEQSPGHKCSYSTPANEISPPNSPASRVCEMYRILEDDIVSLPDASDGETSPAAALVVTACGPPRVEPSSSLVPSPLIKPSSSDKRQSFMSRLFEYAEESDAEICDDQCKDENELGSMTDKPKESQDDPVVSMLDNILAPLDQHTDEVHTSSSPASSPKSSQRSDSNIIAASVVNGVLFDEISEDSDADMSDDEVDIDEVPDIQVLSQLYSGSSRRVTGGTPPPKDLTGPYLEGWKYLGQVVRECNAIESLDIVTSPEAVAVEEVERSVTDVAVATSPVSSITRVDVKWVFFMGCLAKIIGGRKFRHCTKAFFKWKYATTAELSIIAFSPNRSINHLSPPQTSTPVRRSVSFSPDVATPTNASFSKYSGVKLAALVILRSWRNMYLSFVKDRLRHRFAKWKFISVEFAPVGKRKDLTVECASSSDNLPPTTPIPVTPVRTSPRNSDTKIDSSATRSSPRNSNSKADTAVKPTKASAISKPAPPPERVEPEIDLTSLGPLPLDVMPLLHVNEQTLWTLFTHYAPNKLEIPPQTWPERKRYSKRIHNLSSLFILFRDFNVSPFLCNKSTLIRIIDSLDLMASLPVRHKVGSFGGKELSISFSGFWKILWAIARDCLSAPSGKDPVSRLLNLLQRMDGSGGRAKMASGSRDAKLLPPFQFFVHTHTSPQKPPLHKYSTSISASPETPGTAFVTVQETKDVQCNVTSVFEDSKTKAIENRSSAIADIISHGEVDTPSVSVHAIERMSSPIRGKVDKATAPQSEKLEGEVDTPSVSVHAIERMSSPIRGKVDKATAPQSEKLEVPAATLPSSDASDAAGRRSDALSSSADEPIMFNKSPTRKTKRSHSAGEVPQPPAVILSPGRVPRRPLDSSGHSTPTSVGSPAPTQAKGPRGLSAKLFPNVGIALDIDTGSSSPGNGGGSRDGNPKFSPAVRREMGPSTPLSIDEDESRVVHIPPPAPSSSPAITGGNDGQEGLSLRQRRNPNAKAFNLETQLTDTGTIPSAACSPLHGETIEPQAFNNSSISEGSISKVTTLALLWMEKSADRSRISNTPRRRPSTASTASSEDGERRKVIGGGAGLIQRDGSLSKMTTDSRDSPRDLTDDDVDPNSSQFASLPADTLNVHVRGSLSSASDSADPPIPSTSSSENSPFSGSPRIGTPKRRPGGITRRR